jgi:TldD protein
MLQQATQDLLEPAGLGSSELDHALAGLMRGRIDFGDLYFQRRQNEGWSLEDGIVKSGSFSIDQGVGVRAIAGPALPMPMRSMPRPWSRRRAARVRSPAPERAARWQ